MVLSFTTAPSTSRGITASSRVPAGHTDPRPRVRSGAFRYIREDFFLGTSFRNLDDLNIHLRRWLDTVATPRLHATTQRIVNEAFATKSGSYAASRSLSSTKSATCPSLPVAAICSSSSSMHDTSVLRAPPLPDHTLTASRATARLRGRDNDQRGARYRARFNRATTLYPVGPRTRTTMQSCASAAKLRSGGPILPVGMKAKGLVGVRHIEPSSALSHKSSKVCSPQSAIARCVPRDVFPTRPRSP